MTTSITRSPLLKGKVDAVICTDCEGGTVRADQAFELVSEKVDDGNHVYTQVSRYDDFTAYATKRKGYNAGDTLRLFLPILKAYGLTEQHHKDFVYSRKLKVLEGADDANDILKSAGTNRFEISTSYRPFAERVADRFGIPCDRVYATPFELDKYSMDSAEASRIKRIVKEISQVTKDNPLPRMAIPGEQEPPKGRVGQTLEKLDHLIWKEMGELRCAKQILSDVAVMGGRAKVAAVYDTLHRRNVQIERAVYIGDSITDRDVLLEVRESGGVAISFNGSRHAVTAASHVAWGPSYLISAIAAELFRQLDRGALDTFAETAGRERTIFMDAGLKRYDKKLPKECEIRLYDPSKEQEWWDKSEWWREKTLGPKLGQTD